MIKKLKWKFIIITTFATIFVTGTIFGVITFASYHSSNKQIDELINIIIENDGVIPEYKDRYEAYSFMTQETKFSTRYFTVKVDSDGNIIETDTMYIAAVSEEDIEDIVLTVLSNDNDSDYYNNYKYKIVDKDEYKLIVFLDCTLQLNNIKSTTEKSFVIIVIGISIVFIIVLISSNYVLKPLIDNIEKQKQFITNASHELKTPLAVITADIDILEMTVGEDNEWINSIKNQSNRLNTLIKTLLNLSNIEEGQARLEKTNFNISDIISKQVDDFKVLMKDKKIEYIDEKDIQVNAEINMIEQLISILLDNARKYTPENGKIVIKTSKQGKNAKIEIANTCENIRNINTDKLFDRFYREDKSRNKKQEGYGIGLSIAKSIVDLHDGKIFAEIIKDDMINFKIIL